MKSTQLLLSFLFIQSLQFVSSFSEVLGSNDLSVTVDVNGSYIINVGGNDALFSGPTALHANGNWYSTTSTSSSYQLNLKQNIKWKGTDDKFGSFAAVSLIWTATGGGGVTFNTTFKSFNDHNKMIWFEQQFPNGAAETGLADQSRTMSSFPTFTVNPQVFASYFAYQKMWHLDTTNKLTENGTLIGFKGGKNAGFPLVLTDVNATNALLISPGLNFPIATHVHHENFMDDSVVCGLSGTITSIPQGFLHRTMMLAGSGVTDVVYRFGDYLLKQTGKPRYNAWEPRDLPTTYIGYWTDNGAYYYYNTEPNKNYEQTIIDVVAAIRADQIPIQYIQLDSWWYYKDKTTAVTNWDATPDVFPNGMKNLHETLGLPFELHNRWWSPQNVYTNYTWVKETRTALPQDQKFWDFLLSRALNEYGCLVYEQDWLIDQYNWMNITTQDVNAARTWLKQMGNSAQNLGMTIQYCMPRWNDFLESTEVNAVYQIRVSDDYQPEKYAQWAIGYSSLLAWAVGLVPFKDVFWSTSIQPGNRYNGTEPNPELQALISALSTGPLGFGDKMHNWNKTLLMQTCTQNGTLLKADKPATPIDISFSLWNGPNGQVYNTYSNQSGYVWNYVLAANLSEPFQLYPHYLQHIGVSNSFRQVEFHNPSLVSPFSETMPMHLKGFTDFKNWPLQYYLVVPVLPNEFIFFGEMTKFVTMSRTRWSNLQMNSSSIMWQANGSPGETFSFSTAHAGCTTQLLTTTCTFTGYTMTVICSFSKDISCNCYN